MSNFNGKIIEKLTSKVRIYLLIIIILSIILCMYDLRWIIPTIILVIGLIIYSIFDQNRKVTETTDITALIKGYTYSDDPYTFKFTY